MKISRREWLKAGGAGTLGVLLGGCRPGERAVAKVRGRDGGGPRRVILLVSDGMSAGVLDLADGLSRLARGRGTSWYTLLREPLATHGWLETHSLNSRVTDSAAAASAWGTGSLVQNGHLNYLPDGTMLTPLAPLLQAAGVRVGLVTTDRAAGATPAGFAAQARERNDFQLIAPQFLDRADVLLGGGRVDFDAVTRKDGVDWIGRYQHAGYDFVSRREEILGRAPASRRRLLGLFGEKTLPYTLDQLGEAGLRERLPTLAEMTRQALGVLGAEGQPFFLMVEGARVDHAAHLNDAAALIWEQIAFEDAVGEALQFAAADGETLILITTDHGNANPGLSGMGPSYSLSNEAFATVMRSRVSFTALVERIRQGGAVAGVGGTSALVQELLGVELQSEEAKALHEASGIGLTPEEQRSGQIKLGAMLGGIMGKRHGILFAGSAHTSNPSPLTAVGPGAEAWAGLRSHPDLFHQISAAFGIEFRNPVQPAG